VEAGLIIKELVLRKLVTRALILVPHHLPDQWVEEMKEKLELPFVGYTGPTDWGKPFLVASIAAFTHPANPPKLQRMKPYDLVVVDEMHNLLTPFGNPSKGWQLLNALPRKYLLMLSATPVRRHIKELFYLVSLIRPGHFESEAQFLRRFQSNLGGTKVNHGDELRAALQEVMIRNTRQSMDASLLPPKRQVNIEELIASRSEVDLLDHTLLLAQQGQIRLSKAVLEDVHSSTAALIGLARGHAGLYPAHLQKVLAPGAAVPDSKLDRALEIIRDVQDQVIVFTRNRTTADAMAARVKLKCRAEASKARSAFSGKWGRSMIIP